MSARELAVRDAVVFRERRTRRDPLKRVYAKLSGVGETNRVPRGSFVHVLPTPARTVTPDEFEQRLAPILAHLRGVLIARHGIDAGLDVHAEVSSFAWEQRNMVCGLDNPGGYLFRVSQSRARRYRRWGRTAPLPAEPAVGLSEGDPRLDEAMAQLTKDERTVCVLVHGYGYRYEEAAELLGWSTASVRNRLSRAMAKLRRLLHEEDPR